MRGRRQHKSVSRLCRRENKIATATHAHFGKGKEKADLKRNAGLLFDNVFDGSFLAHDLKSPIGKKFRCQWHRQYAVWADRDQAGGAYVLGMMNYEYNGRKSGGGFNECVALGKTDRDHAFQVRAFWESRINDLTVQSRQSQNQDGLPAFAHISRTLLMQALYEPSRLHGQFLLRLPARLLGKCG